MHKPPLIASSPVPVAESRQVRRRREFLEEFRKLSATGLPRVIRRQIARDRLKGQRRRVVLAA